MEGGESYRSPPVADGRHDRTAATPRPGEVPIADVVPEYMGDDLELAVIPTPRRSELQPTMIRVGRARVTGGTAGVEARVEQILGGSGDVAHSRRGRVRRRNAAAK